MIVYPRFDHKTSDGSSSDGREKCFITSLLSFLQSFL